MFEFLWWAFLSAASVGLGFHVNGTPGAIFLGGVCALGGAFLLIERHFPEHHL